MRRLDAIAIGGVLGAALLLQGCSAVPDEVRPDIAGEATILVPADASSIQEAVDAAQPGDTIEVGPGTYEESVEVTTDDLTIRGTDRNEVILDGAQMKSNGIVVTSDRVRVENLTVQNYTINGVLVTGMSDDSGGLASGSNGYERLDPEEFPPIDGFAVRYVTAANNGLYGIYAFNSQNGLLAHNYASGSSDSGIYVGQCEECNIVVRDNVAEYNAVGYEHTNASDSVSVVGNRFSGNRLGMTLLSDYQEAFIPLRDVYVAGNVISDNSVANTPAHAEGGFGIGVGIAGAQNVELTENLIADNSRSGVNIASAEDLPPEGNSLIDNTFVSNGLDVAYTASERAPGAGNCIAGDVGATIPNDLTDTWGCPGGHPESMGGTLPPFDVPDGVPFSEVSKPGPQPSLPADDDFELAEATMFDADAYSTPEADFLDDYTQSTAQEG